MKFNLLNPRHLLPGLVLASALTLGCSDHHHDYDDRSSNGSIRGDDYRRDSDRGDDRRASDRQDMDRHDNDHRDYDDHH